MDGIYKTSIEAQLTKKAETDDDFGDVFYAACHEALMEKVFSKVNFEPDPDFKPTPEELAKHEAARIQAEKSAKALTEALFGDGDISDLLKILLK
ncbi:MAG: hypothetical protein PHX61_08095 [Alphaproteobacteria bacterium]|nr:hypothetical protein [Alphaproteobacteria bacterium]